MVVMVVKIVALAVEDLKVQEEMAIEEFIPRLRAEDI